MEIEEVIEEPRYPVRALKFLGMALAILGLFLVLINIQADDAAAVPIPNVGSGTLYVNTNTVWDSGSATWAGNVYVQSPAKLTMKNVKVTWTTSYRYFRVYDNAEVEWENVTMTGSSSSVRYYMYYYANAKVRVNDSYIQYCYYNYVRGWDQQFTNTTFIDGYYYGAYIYAYGVNWNNDGPIFRNNLFVNKYYGLYMYMWGASATPIIEDNIIMNNQYYGIYLYGGGNAKILRNTMIKNKQDGIYLNNPGSGVQFDNNMIQNNNGYGLRAYYINSELTIYNNVINQNGNSDIYLYSSKIRSVNNTIGKVSAQQNSELNVYWFMDVGVEWEDGSGPVADADVTFLDAQGEGLIEDDVTGADGWIKNIEVKEYSWQQSGKKMYSPYTVNATKFDIKASVEVEVSKNSVAKLVLDNVPPMLQIEAPIDMSLTNNRLILVRGLTEPGATCTVNHLPVPVGETGWFETYINYTTDGTHEILVEVKDPSKNMMNGKRTIIIDTIKPTLAVNNPEDGLLTNQAAIEVQGETEPGAFAEIDGRTVVVDNNGRFSRLILLEEGRNIMFLKVWDQAGNTNEANVTVNLDSTPPNLVLLEPVDRSSVSSQDIKVVGFIEDSSTLKINNLQVRYQGGTFQHSVRLEEGLNTILIEAWDPAGNYNSKTLTVTLDMKPPKLVILAPENNMFTNQRIVLVAGETDTGSTVVINNVKADVDPGTGYFEGTYVLKSGNNKITIVATDKYGNSVSQSVMVIHDNDPPDLTLLTPENGTVTNQDTIRVEGIAGLDATVIINGREVLVDKGKFSAYIELDEGENEILIIARDEALNTESEKLSVIKDSVVDLRVSFPYDGMYTTEDIINITGSTDVGGMVYVNKNLKAPVDFDGNFRTQLSLEIGQNDIEVSSTDDLGNSESVTMIVTREEAIIEPIKKPRSSQPTATTDNSWMVAMAAFLGIVVGAAIMGGAYLYTKKGMEESNRDMIEEILRQRDEERTKKESLTTMPGEGPPVIPGYKGPPLHVTRSAPRPPGPPSGGPPQVVPGPPPMRGHPRTLSAVQGEADAPTGDTEMNIDPEVASCEQRLREADQTGADTTKPKNSLKLAKFFMGKGDKEKMAKYVKKTNELLDQIGGS